MDGRDVDLAGHQLGQETIPKSLESIVFDGVNSYLRVHR